jgi:phosphoglycerate dehydrogenase-like enzyme
MIDRDRTSPVDVLITVPFSENEIQALGEVSPRLRIHFLPVREVREIPSEILTRCEVMYTDRVLPTPEQVPALRWIQLHFAGVDFALEQPIFHKPEILVTTLSGAAAPQMAEFALTMILALGHRLQEITASQARAEWPRERWERFRPLELRGSTVGIVGYGSIGRETARLLNAFGANVLAAKRDVMHPEDPGYMIPGLGDPGGDLFQRLYPYQALKSMFKECDFVVVVLPLTAETRGLIGAAELNAMKPSAYLISMARGGIIDQAALLTALQEKHIAGAALDVFAEEPLLANHPFWRLPNVIVSAHIGGMSTQYNRRAIELFIENCKRYLAGSPVLNRFDPLKGY